MLIKVKCKRIKARINHRPWERGTLAVYEYSYINGATVNYISDLTVDRDEDRIADHDCYCNVRFAGFSMDIYFKNRSNEYDEFLRQVERSLNEIGNVNEHVKPDWEE